MSFLLRYLHNCKKKNYFILFTTWIFKWCRDEFFLGREERRELKLVLKKKGRNLAKAIGAENSKGTTIKATKKKVKKNKDKAKIWDFEVQEEGENDEQKDKEEENSRWKDVKVDTLIVVCKKLEEGFS